MGIYRQEAGNFIMSSNLLNSKTCEMLVAFNRFWKRVA